MQDPPFNDLRLYSTCSEGVVEIHACKKPMVSFKILDRPHNWQAMLEWIWDYGNKCHVARCIPQLDPRKMSALLIGNERVDEESCLREKGHAYFDYDYECSSGDDPFFYDLLGAARDYLDEKRTGNGVFHLLLAFQYFRPDIYWDKSSTPHPEGGYEKWHVEFLVSSPEHELQDQWLNTEPESILPQSSYST